MATKKSGSVNEAVSERRKRRTMSQSDMIKFFADEGFLIARRIILLGSVQTDVDGEESGTDALMFRKFEVAMDTLEYFDPHAPITIVANNLGGDWYHGMAIYDRILDSPCPVTIKAYGYVMSVMSVILQAADKRLLARNATMLLHYGSEDFAGHSKDFEKRAEESKRNNQQMEDIYLAQIQKKDPKFDRDQLEKFIKHDCYLDATKAIRLGLADGFIPRPRRVPRKQKTEARS